MDRHGSARYWWEEEDFARGSEHEAEPSAGAQYLLLRQQVAQAMDTTGWGSVLIIADAALSLISVLLYVVITYRPSPALYQADLALACVFALNWMFWFWVAEDRVRYTLSFMTLVDVVTIIPAFVLCGVVIRANETTGIVTGLNFLRVLRILRVLRLLRMKHILRRHLEGAVMEAAGKLIFSLLSILFIAAGLFYELEQFGPPEKRKEALSFHQSIYWAAVTLTTVGYGDVLPTYWPTQVMIIALLILTFTLLPYLTGNLMDALSSTSVYQRKSFKASRRQDVSHVVVTGFLDGATVEGLLNDLYHKDKGFNNNRTVFLSERPPSQDVVHVLTSHDASRKLVYLQGSPFRAADLRRAAVEYACAVFIVAPKYPEDVTLADRYLTMVALSLGQYLQEAHVRLQEWLSDAPRRLTHWLWHGTVHPPAHLPAVYLQVAQPEGRLKLFQALQSLQDQRSRTGCGAPRAPPKHVSSTHKRINSAALSSDTTHAAAPGHTPQGAAAAASVPALHRNNDSSWTLKDSTPGVRSACTAVGIVPCDAAAHSDARVPSQGDAAVDISAYYTAPPAAAGPQHRQQHRACPQRANGSSSSRSEGRDAGSASAAPVLRGMPTGLEFWREFSASIHVLCLSELKYALMAQSVVGVPGVMSLLCNLSTTVDFGMDAVQQEELPPWLRDYVDGASQEIYQLVWFPSTLVRRSFREAAGFIFDSCHAVLLAVEPTRGRGRHRMSVADLEQVITEDMRGYIIADDVSAVLMVCAAQEGDFELWAKLRQQHLMQQQQQGEPGSPQPPGMNGSSGHSFASANSTTGAANNSKVLSGKGRRESRHPVSRHHHALKYSSSLELPWTVTGRHHSAVMTQPLGAYRTPSSSSIGAAQQRLSASRQASGGSNPASTQQLQPQPPLEARSPLFTAHQQSPQEAGASGAGPLQAAGHAPQDSMSGFMASAAVAAVAAATAAGAVGTTRAQHTGRASELGALMHLLRSPSRMLRRQGQSFLRRHYHLRPPGVVEVRLQLAVLEPLPSAPDKA